jgi:hypothetical protein
MREVVLGEEEQHVELGIHACVHAAVCLHEQVSDHHDLFDCSPPRARASGRAGGCTGRMELNDSRPTSVSPRPAPTPTPRGRPEVRIGGGVEQRAALVAQQQMV